MKTIILTCFLIMASSCQTIRSYDEKYTVIPMFITDTYYIIYEMNGYGSRDLAVEKLFDKGFEICQGQYVVNDLFTEVKTSKSTNFKSSVITRYIAHMTITCKRGK